MSQLLLLAGPGLGASLSGANRPQACHAPIGKGGAPYPQREETPPPSPVCGAKAEAA